MIGENKKIPYSCQEIDQSDIESVIEVLKSPLITQGPKINKFEDDLRLKIGSKFAAVLNSATSALHLSCLSLGLESKDNLWTSPISFVASANCGRYCGANINFVDIEKDTCLINIKDFVRRLNEAEKKGTLPKIFVPVHLAGNSCDMKEIFKISRDYGFFIIEDASHAIGGKYNYKYIGNCEFSDICVFSFHPVKIITTGEGGAITTNNKNLYKKIIELRSHGITRNREEFNCKNPPPWLYEQQSLGFNYRITDIQCALGISQLKKLDLFVQKRNELLENYQLLFKNIPVNLIYYPKKEGDLSSVHLAIIRFENPDQDFHLYVFKFLQDNNIGVQIHYSPIHLQPYYQNLGFKKGDFPESEFYSINALSIPLYPELKFEQQKRVVETIKLAIEKYRS